MLGFNDKVNVNSIVFHRSAVTVAKLGISIFQVKDFLFSLCFEFEGGGGHVG